MSYPDLDEPIKKKPKSMPGNTSARMGDSTRAEVPRRKGEREEWR
jgi:hypothetical protein